jgi:hypothetical protein
MPGGLNKSLKRPHIEWKCGAEMPLRASQAVERISGRIAGQEAFYFRD